MRKALPDQWCPENSDPASRTAALRWWIRASEVDTWTYDQLGDLVGWHIDAGEDLPDDLLEWALEKAANRHGPRRPGRKSDPKSDCEVMVEVLWKTMFEGKSANRVYHEIGKRGEPLGKSGGTRSSARRTMATGHPLPDRKNSVKIMVKKVAENGDKLADTRATQWMFAVFDPSRLYRADELGEVAPESTLAKWRHREQGRPTSRWRGIGFVMRAPP